MKIVKYLFIVNIFSIFLFQSIFADESKQYAFIYSLLDSSYSDMSILSSKVILLDESIENSLAYPLNVNKINALDKVLAFSVYPLSEFNQNLIKDNEISTIIYFNSKLSKKSYGFVKFKTFIGTVESFKKKLRNNIEENRVKLTSAIDELKEMNKYIERLRKDARLIAGYNKIEMLKKEKAKIRRQISKKKIKLNFFKRIISSAKGAERPRSFERRQEELVQIINKLAKDTGTDLNLDAIYEQAYQEETTKEDFQDGVTANSQDLLSQYEYLLAERKKLERYFGYEEDEFTINVAF